MRLVSLVWYRILPALYGGQKGTALFNQHLGKLAKLSCLCSKDNESQSGTTFEVINSLPVSKSQFSNPLVCWQIITTLKRQKAAALIVEYPYHAIAAILAKWLLGIKLVLHEHNIEYRRFQRLGKRGWRVLFFFEKLLAKEADLVLFKTKKDRDLAIKSFGLNKDQMMILPYGISQPLPFTKAVEREIILERHAIRQNQKLLLFAGTLDYAPNAAAVEAIYQIIAPELFRTGLSFHILICGRNKLPQYQYLKELQHTHVTYVGETDNIETYYKAADLFLNPVAEGGGTQTKTLDALSFSLPVVGFRHLHEEFDSLDLTTHLLLAEKGDWNHFTALTQQALHQTALPIQDTFFDAYSFERSVQTFYAHLQKLIASEYQHGRN